jgi:hypothetical protein
MGGAHAAELPAADATLLALAPGLKVRWSEVQDKQISQQFGLGRIVRLSADLAQAEVSGAGPAELLATLHLTLLGELDAAIAAPLYARQVGSDPGASFRLHFTSMPDDARAVLAAAVRADAGVA